MKKTKRFKAVLSAVLSALIVVSFTACSGNQNASSSEDTSTPSSENATMSSGSDTADHSENSSAPSPEGEKNILIAYFSLAMEDGVDTVARASRKKYDNGTFGNVRFMANVIQENVGGDLFAIETVQQYPLDNMDSLLEFAYEEKAENARPELATQLENLGDYDVIFIGYPNWNADLPMPMYTFFETYDFSGKTLIPFVAHGGSGASRTVGTIAELEPEATVLDNPATVFWNELDDAENIVTEWVQALEF